MPSLPRRGQTAAAFLETRQYQHETENVSGCDFKFAAVSLNVIGDDVIAAKNNKDSASSSMQIHSTLFLTCI